MSNGNVDILKDKVPEWTSITAFPLAHDSTCFMEPEGARKTC